MNTKRNYHDANNLGSIAENFIIVAIIFALVITILDEFATVYDFSLSARHFIIIASFLTDILFTGEFTARMIVTGKHGAAKHYFMHQRGWIDFLSSIPLLLLSSGPEVLLLFFPELFASGAGLGFISSIKIVKAVRVSRILRLLRLLKVMGKIHNTDSQMANRHVATISTIATMAFIVVYSLMSFTGLLGFHEIENQQEIFFKQLAINIQKEAGSIKGTDSEKQDRAREYLTGLMVNVDSSQPNIAQVYYKGRLLISNFSESYIKSHFKFDERAGAAEKFDHDTHVHTLREGDVIIHVNTWPVMKEKARVNIMVFFGIVAIILSFMFVYSRHFVQNITDVVHIMQKGIDDKNFNLEVSIRKDFETDEIFVLAQSYNDKLLPEKLKNQAANENQDTGGLSMDDFLS
jgi:hypothetical protein